MMRSLRLRPILLVAPLLLAGCGSTIPVPTTVQTPGMPNPEVALRESMQHVDAEMAELGQMGPARADLGASLTGMPVVPEPLKRIVSFDWTGPLDEGVAKLAASVGYTFYTTAPTAAQPLSVSVKLDAVPAYRVFQALGEEAGVRATVQLDPQHHQVEVIHHV